MSDNKILYLSRADVEAVNLDMATIIKLLEQAFIDKGHGKVEMPPKPGIHTMPDAFIHAMPAYIPSMKSAGIKWVSGYPENFRRGLPYITGLLILNDDETGIPYAVMDCTWITAYRTGAASLPWLQNIWQILAAKWQGFWPVVFRGAPILRLYRFYLKLKGSSLMTSGRMSNPLM